MTRLSSNEVLMTGTGMALAGLALGSALLRRAPVHIGDDGRGWPVGRLPNRRPKTSATVRAARRLNRAAGTLAASVLADSGIEHYRGSFKNKAMFTPLIVSALTLATSIHGTSDMRPVAHRARDTTYLLAAATGLIGTGFHIYNVGKKVGGFSWQNFFYAAPLGAPMAILLSGLVGFCSERVRESEPGTRPEIFDLPAGRTMAAVVGRRPAGHDRRSRSAPLPWRVSQPIHDASGDAAAARCGDAGVGRGRGARHENTASRAGGCGCWPRWVLSASDFTPTAYPATWAAGATGVRTSSTGRRCRRRRALRASRSPVLPRSA